MRKPSPKKPKASDLKAPLPAQRLVEDAPASAPDTTQATIDDLLADTNGDAPPADAPI